MNNLKYILTLLFTSLVFTSFSQRVDPDEAAEHFKYGNFIDALVVYEKLMIKDPKNPEYPYKAGFCVLHINNDKSKAIKYLELASERKSDPDVDFYLAKAYHYNLKLDQAIETMEKYKKSGEGKLQDQVDREIEMMKNAKKLVVSPIDISFENVGDLINSEYPDYYPFVTPNESTIYFTTRRKGVVGGMREFDGYYSSDIFYSVVENGEFVKAKGAGMMVNSAYDEQIVGLSYNADLLFVYLDHIKDYGDIYTSKIVKGRARKIEKMDKSVNSKEFESAATISADGNTLFFASKRDGGLGGKDIWMTRKSPTGEWAEPQNLGPNINTPFDEDFPNLFYDGSTLYFSSKGHNSMGGFDYFKSTWNAETNEWSLAENIGFPLNTPEDNVCISFTEDKRHAYISAWRKDSYGDLDIYKVKFNEYDDRQTIIKSKIVKEGTDEVITDAFVIVTDNRTQEEIGNYTPNSKNGSFIITLIPGSYNVMIDAPGFAPKSEDIHVKGKSDFEQFINKDFTVTP
ncbi:MAG: hypothetical protein RQ875_01535 [Vicingaceae bacterium]|nr:hypothetical protein [Vicingaceae bacterium]